MLVAPSEIWIESAHALALMFLDRVDEARTIHLQYRGAQKVHAKRLYAVVSNELMLTRHLIMTTIHGALFDEPTFVHAKPAGGQVQLVQIAVVMCDHHHGGASLH